MIYIVLKWKTNKLTLEPNRCKNRKKYVNYSLKLWLYNLNNIKLKSSIKNRLNKTV